MENFILIGLWVLFITISFITLEIDERNNYNIKRIYSTIFGTGFYIVGQTIGILTLIYWIFEFIKSI